MADGFVRSFSLPFVVLGVVDEPPIWARFALGLDEKKRAKMLGESIIPY